MSWEICEKCGKTLSCKQALRRHEKICKAGKMIRPPVRDRSPIRSAWTPNIDITATKICEKKPGDKRAACDEIIHFDSDEFEHGEPKPIETLKKLGSLVNKEVQSEKSPPPTIKYISAVSHDEMLKPIPPPIIEDVHEILKPIPQPMKDDKQEDVESDDETDM